MLIYFLLLVVWPLLLGALIYFARRIVRSMRRPMSPEDAELVRQIARRAGS